MTPSTLRAMTVSMREIGVPRTSSGSCFMTRASVAGLKRCPIMLLSQTNVRDPDTKTRLILLSNISTRASRTVELPGIEKAVDPTSSRVREDLSRPLSYNPRKSGRDRRAPTPLLSTTRANPKRLRWKASKSPERARSARTVVRDSDTASHGCFKKEASSSGRMCISLARHEKPKIPFCFRSEPKERGRTSISWNRSRGRTDSIGVSGSTAGYALSNIHGNACLILNGGLPGYRCNYSLSVHSEACSSERIISRFAQAGRVSML